MPLPDPESSPQVCTSGVECPLGFCDGSGWVCEKGDKPGYGTYSECLCLLQRERKQRTERLLQSAQVPTEYADVRLIGLDGRHHNALTASARYVSNWPDEHGRGLLYVGDVGVGKTTMAFGVFNGLLARGVEGIATNGPRLLRDLGRGTVDKQLDARLDLLIAAPLLLIDDMAAHRTATQFAAECVYQIVHERYAARRPTLYTAMYDVPAWGGTEDPKIGQLWRAIGSRVIDRSEAFLLDGPDRRTERLQST